jgi:hypothetical protein
MKTRIRFSKTLVVLIFAVLWINGSGFVNIEMGGTGKISGYIRSAGSNQPLEYAAVTLFSATDSSMVAGTITNSDGSFFIYMITAGNYFLEIGESGFEKKLITGLNIRPDHPKIDIGEVQLNPDAENIKKYFKKVNKQKIMNS